MTGIGGYIGNQYVSSMDARSISSTGGFLGIGTGLYISSLEARALANYGGMVGNQYVSSMEARSIGFTPSSCYGVNAPGLNNYCYQQGYAHGSPSTNPDAVGDALSTIACISEPNANYCYGLGYQDAMRK